MGPHSFIKKSEEEFANIVQAKWCWQLLGQERSTLVDPNGIKFIEWRIINSEVYCEILRSNPKQEMW